MQLVQLWLLKSTVFCLHCALKLFDSTKFVQYCCYPVFLHLNFPVFINLDFPIIRQLKIYNIDHRTQSSTTRRASCRTWSRWTGSSWRTRRPPRTGRRRPQRVRPKWGSGTSSCNGFKNTKNFRHRCYKTVHAKLLGVQTKAKYLFSTKDTTNCTKQSFTQSDTK